MFKCGIRLEKDSLWEIVGGGFCFDEVFEGDCGCQDIMVLGYAQSANYIIFLHMRLNILLFPHSYPQSYITASACLDS